EVDLEAMNAGAADYLIKGQFDSRQLERSIRHALERRRAQNQSGGQEREIREQVETAKALAKTDPLTGLGNRRRAEEAIQAAISSGRPFSLLVFDLNGLKPINDRYGHNRGDQLLKQVALGLSNAVRGSDVVCRWGGDEFVIVLPNAELSDAER